MKKNFLLTGPLLMAYDGTTGPLPPQHQGGRTDSYLTDVAVADNEADQDFLTPQVFPTVNVATASGDFQVWDRGTLLRPEFRDHAYGDRPVQAQTKKKEGHFRTSHRSLERVIDPEDVASSRDPMAPAEDATLYLTGQARLDIDLRFIEGFMTKGAGWAFEYAGVASNPNKAADSPEFLRFDQPGVNVAQFIRERVRRMRLMTGRKPNRLLLGSDVAAALAFNEDIVDRVKYVQKGVADLDLMAGFFDLDQVLDATGVYNAALEGQDDDFQYVVDPRSMLLTYAAPRPSRNVPSGGYTFVWDNLYTKFKGESERIGDGLTLIRRGYDDRSGADWVQAHTALGMNIVAPDLGMLFTDVVEAAASDW